MNEKTMTLEELIQYAQEAKEETEKERLSIRDVKDQKRYEIIEKIIDMLRAKKGDSVTVKNRGTHWFAIDDAEYEVKKVVITLDEIYDIIRSIPALKPIMTYGGATLKVWFSETDATDADETDDSEDK